MIDCFRIVGRELYFTDHIGYTIFHCDPVAMYRDDEQAIECWVDSGVPRDLAEAAAGCFWISQIEFDEWSLEFFSRITV